MAHEQSNDETKRNGEGPLDFAPRRVDVRAIEKELTRLWQSAGEGSEHAVTRARALNLVVHVEREEGAAEVSEAIAHAAMHDPNRAIVVISDGSGESGLEAWISAHCYLPAPNSPQVCSEQIMITARGDAVEQAPGLVLPLLVADLPVVLWWVGDPPIGDESFERFAAAAHRIILDSADFANPSEKLPLLARRVQGPLRQPAISDLSWARLTSWRELAAQFFDAPEMLGYLGEVRSVRVEYAVRPETPPNSAQAAMLLGWLGSRLGWQLVPGSQAPIDTPTPRLLSPNGESIDGELVSVSRPDVESGTVVGLAIRAAGRQPATFTIASEPGGDCVVTRAEIEGRPPIGRTICPALQTVHHLLCQELEFVGRDQIYEEALLLISG